MAEPLFRQEVIEASRERLAGTVVAAVPPSSRFYTWLVVGVVALGGLGFAHGVVVVVGGVVESCVSGDGVVVAVVCAGWVAVVGVVLVVLVGCWSRCTGWISSSPSISACSAGEIAPSSPASQP